MNRPFPGRPCNPLVILALLLASGVFLAALDRLEAPLSPAPRLRYGLHAGEEPADLAWVRRAGFDWAVVVFSWRDVEPLPGRWSPPWPPTLTTR
jgi:hypothetical protein